MLDYKKNSNNSQNTTGNMASGTPKTPAGYNSRLQSILAKAGQGSTRSPKTPQAQAQPNQTTQTQPNAGTTGQVTQQPFTTPSANQNQQAAQATSANTGQPVPQNNAQPGQAPGNPYQNKLNAILAAAGGQAPLPAKPAPNSVAARITGILANFKMTSMQDPSKVLEIEDMEFDPNDGEDTIYLRLATVAQNGACTYDIFGCDIDHCLPDAITNNYELVPTTYYRQVPEDVLMTEMNKASGMGATRIV